MGGFTMSNQAILDRLLEMVGFKAGLTLTQARLMDLISRMHPHIAAQLSVPDGATRLSSVEHLELTAALLHAVGACDVPKPVFVQLDVERTFRDDPVAASLVAPIAEAFAAYTATEDAFLSPGGANGVNPFLVEMHDRYSDRGADVALAFLRLQIQAQQQHIADFRTTDWIDQRDLEDLFASERLEAQYGRFFDQRFINYLRSNFEAIDEIHWRQLEAVTAEHFARQGFEVELGPGRGDGGVDVRVFPKGGEADRPPLILVQCKRQQAQVEALVVKALHADVVHEKARSGLIVTTSRLSRGAQVVRTARAYPIQAAERENLRIWLMAMRRASD